MKYFISTLFFGAILIWANLPDEEYNKKILEINNKLELPKPEFSYKLNNQEIYKINKITCILGRNHYNPQIITECELNTN